MSDRITTAEGKTIDNFPANHFQQFFNRQWGAGLAKESGDGTDVMGHNGLVAEEAAPAMSVQTKDLFGAGKGVILGDKFLIDVFKYSTVITAADPTNPRIDKIVARPLKMVNKRGLNEAQSTQEKLEIVAIPGTPAASPVADGALEYNDILLAHVFVPAGATKIEDVHIDNSVKDFLCDIESLKDNVFEAIDQVQDDIAGLSAEFDSFKTLVTTKIDALDTSVGALSTAVGGLQAQLTAIQTDFDDLERRVRTNEEAIAEINIDLAIFNVRINTNESNIIELFQRLGDANGDIQANLNLINQLQQDLAQLRSDAEGQDVQLQTDIDAVAADLGVLAGELQSTQGDINDLFNSISDNVAALAALDTRVSALESGGSGAPQEVIDRLDSLEASVASLEAALLGAVIGGEANDVLDIADLDGASSFSIGADGSYELPLAGGVGGELFSDNFDDNVLDAADYLLTHVGHTDNVGGQLLLNTQDVGGTANRGYILTRNLTGDAAGLPAGTIWTIEFDAIWTADQLGPGKSSTFLVEPWLASAAGLPLVAAGAGIYVTRFNGAGGNGSSFGIDRVNGSSGSSVDVPGLADSVGPISIKLIFTQGAAGQQNTVVMEVNGNATGGRTTNVNPSGFTGCNAWRLMSTKNNGAIAGDDLTFKFDNFKISSGAGGSGSFLSPGTLLSTIGALDAAGDVRSAFLSLGSEVKPAGTGITYEISLDDQLNWEAITPGVEFDVASSPTWGASVGSITKVDLRVTMTTTDTSATPSVKNIAISTSGVTIVGLKDKVNSIIQAAIDAIDGNAFDTAVEVIPKFA